MKNYVFSSFFLIAISSLNNIYSYDKLFDAIDRSDLSNVEYYIEKEKDSITQQRKELLLQAARDAVIRKQTKLSIFSSGSDILKMFFGSFLTGTGLTIFWVGGLGSVIADSPQAVAVSMGSGSLITLYGLYKMYKGWTLSAAYTNLNKAREIENLIKDIKIKNI